MTRLFLSALPGMALCMLMSGCKKSLSSFSSSHAPAIQIAEARNWFQHSIQNSPSDPANSNNPRTHSSKWPLWDQARTLQLPDRSVIVVPLHYEAPLYVMNHTSGSPLYTIDEVARLIIYLDSGAAYHAEVVTALPDSSFSRNAASLLSGMVLIEQWNGSPLYRLHSDGHNILINDPNLEPSTFAAGLITETCYEIDGYNYAADDPDNGESWTEDAGCTPNYYFGSPSSSLGLTAKSYLDIGGGAGAAPPSPAGMFAIISGDNPIADIRAYMKCFQNVTGSQYTVTLAVDQPVAGSRIPIYFPQIQNGGGFTVGHTFLIFQETTGNGTITIRSIGFYPKQSVNPTSPNGAGQLNDDEGSYSNISLSISVSGQQFINMVNYAVNSANNDYNLNSYNCTTWALSCLSAGGINISTTQGDWLMGKGDDPGDLGEDIRTMTLPQGSTLNPIGFDAPHNVGNCQ